MKKYILALIVLLLIPLFSWIQYLMQPYKVMEGNTQGTTFRIIYQPRYSAFQLFNTKTGNYRDEIDTLLASLDHSLSIYDPNSVISRINANVPGADADEYLIDVFKKSLEVTLVTEGAFDITVGPLVNAWGFGPEARTTLDQKKIDSLLQYVGMDKVKLEGRQIRKSLPGIKLDVNAIAQGYSIDRVGKLLERKGVKNYLVEIGGELITRGSKKHHVPWVIGIDKPVDQSSPANREIQEILEVYNISLATSGNYRKFYIENGMKYSHTIDPKTGYPARNSLLSATVVACDCMTADAFATACMVMGLEKSRLLIREMDDLEAYFIYSDAKGDFQVEYSEGFKQFIQKEPPGE
jgi:thiamine biosynthesis lipoprotein